MLLILSGEVAPEFSLKIFGIALCRSNACNFSDAGCGSKFSILIDNVLRLIFVSHQFVIVSTHYQLFSINEPLPIPKHIDTAYHTTAVNQPKQSMEDNVPSSAGSKDPASFLSSIIGAPVTVKLNSGVVYKGELQSVDGYMNIALEKCQEFVDGQLRRNYGDAFVRGNNVLYIST